MKIIITESQLGRIMEQVGDMNIGLDDVWGHYIGANFDWMIETHFGNKYDEQDMVLYFRFLRKYMLDMIEEDIRGGVFGEDVKIGFTMDELNGSYDLFVDMVKKHMSERGNIESEDDVLVRGVLGRNGVAMKRMGMRLIKSYYEDAKKSLNIFDYLGGKDRLRDKYDVEDDMISDRSAGYGFFGRDIIEWFV